MSDLPPASNKKPDGCIYPRCACNDSFCKEGNPMNNPVDELKPCPFCPSGGDVDPDGWLDGNGNRGPECLECGATARSIEAWNTRAESPDSVVVTTNEQGQAVAVTRQDGEGQILSTIWESPDSVKAGKWSAIWIDAQDKQPSIKFWAKSHTDVERICDALSNSADTLSPPPPVAAEGELIDKLGKWISGLPKDKPCPGREMADAIVLITESYIALQSRSTPPPVAGGELQKNLAMLKEEIIGSMDNENAEAWAQDTLGQAVAALQHQDCVFISRECVEWLLANPLADHSRLHSACSDFIANGGAERAIAKLERADRYTEELKQSLERKNGQ